MEQQANPPIASPLDELLIKRPMPSLRVAAWPIMILITVVLTWANFAKLDEVSVALGKVVPLGKTKVVQHLEGEELRVLAFPCRVGQRHWLNVARTEANGRDSLPVVVFAHDAVDFQGALH